MNNTKRLLKPGQTVLLYTGPYYEQSVGEAIKVLKTFDLEAKKIAFYKTLEKHHRREKQKKDSTLHPQSDWTVYLNVSEFVAYLEEKGLAERVEFEEETLYEMRSDEMYLLKQIHRKEALAKKQKEEAKQSETL